MLTIMSLFDGLGGFLLAGQMAGMKPVYASEIEKYPMTVSAARFPDVIQLGSVTDIDGAAVEPVDVITFGSPCQDLSVAGKQLGIHDGQRSNLFFEAIRIIKEMRDADKANGRTGKHIRPRFAVWENVPGAFSSNKGDDFRAVLEAFASVCENDISIPRPKKWNTGGGMAGHGWSLAWRVYDAQYWGVPQRRKRIYLVADFGSERADEILFVEQGLRGDSETCGETREGTAADAERGAGRSGGVGLTNRGYVSGDQSETLRAESHMALPCVVQTAAFMGGMGAKARSIAYKDDGTTPTLKSSPSGGNTVPDVCYALQGNGIDRADTAGCNGCGWRENEMYTLNTVGRPAIAFQQNQRDEVRDMGEHSGALTSRPGAHNQKYLCYPDKARSLCARYDSSPCADRGQNVVCYRKSAKPRSAYDSETWVEDGAANTLNTYENSDVRTTEAVVYRAGGYGGMTEGCGTLRANGGDAGGGTESIVIERV